MKMEDEYGREGEGMEQREAYMHAERWWDGIGRHLLSNELGKVNEFRAPNNVSHEGRTIIKSSPERDIPSGVLNGLPWDQLKKNECFYVMRCWYKALIVQARADEFILDPAAHTGGETEAL